MQGNPSPPRLAAWLLERFRIRGDSDILLGDFEEEYHILCNRYGVAYARRWYWVQVAASLPGLLDQWLRWSAIMLTNYLKIALRTLRKQPGYTVINLFGLALGLACCIIIYLYVADEFSYDRFHTNAEHIYRLERTQPNGGRSAFTDGPSGPTLATNYPEIEAAVRFSPREMLARVGDRQFYGEDVLFTDSTFFSVFSFTLLQGNPQTALTAPNSIVITASFAQKYFGERDPMGALVLLDNEDELVVTGVVEDVPSNSHFDFDALTTMQLAQQKYPYMKRWGSISLQTYVLLVPQADPAAVEAKFETFLTQYQTFADALHLRPLLDIHLYSNVFERYPQGDIEALYLFGVIAFFILLLACINYMNLATARSAQRMKEVGMRKVLGADRKQLALQFLGESVVMTLLAMGLTLLIVQSVLPLFNTFLDRSLSLVPFFQAQGLLLLLAFSLFVGVAAGLYPALYLAHFQPVKVLKGSTNPGSGGSLFRQGLVVVQFVVSIALLAATLIVSAQLDYVQSRNLGFEEEHVVAIQLRDQKLLERAEGLRQTLLNDAQVVAASISNSGIEIPQSSAPVAAPEFGELTDASPITEFVFSDKAFPETLGLTVLAGEGFDEAKTSQTDTHVILNEAAVKRYGWATPEDAIGKTLESRITNDPFTVIGVVNDFHTRSLRRQVTPMMLFNVWLQRDGVLLVRLQPGDARPALARFEALWNDRIPEWPFEYNFLDETVASRYAGEHQTRQLFTLFASLAILIACLGLFSLAAYTATRRTKEIGIRKVMGATVNQIVLLLSKEFTRLVLVAFVIATPIAALLMDRWLDDFAFRIDLPWYIFALAGFMALAIAWLTVSYQSIKAALGNPVRALRHE